MAYCIYTDTEVTADNGNWDHVIPLALGGRDEFCVWSDRDINSKLGSEVDGAIANDPLLAFALRNAQVVGHKGKLKEPIWKRSQIDGQPFQVTWSSDQVKFWDAKSKTYVSENDMLGKEITSQIRLNGYSAIRFVAKVALGGGYFVFGDVFRRAIDCDELRKLMWLNPEEARRDDWWLQSTTTVCDRFHQDAHDPTSAVYLYKVLTECTGRSTFITVPHNDGISFHVGIAGMYIGSITCVGDSSALPSDRSDQDCGHVIVLEPGDMQRLALRQFAYDFQKARFGTEPPLPDAAG